MRMLPFPSNLVHVEERFWNLVDSFGKTSDECWPWTGGRWNNEYGVFKMYYNGEWKRYKAHRVAYRLHYGVDLEHLGCHTCDNPWCVNPYHIFDGTNADNLADMKNKGRAASGERSGRITKPERTARGERSGNAKLSEDDIRTIRREYRRVPVGHRNPSLSVLVSRFGIDRTHVHAIATGRTWSHVPVEERGT